MALARKTPGPGSKASANPTSANVIIGGTNSASRIWAGVFSSLWSRAHRGIQTANVFFIPCLTSSKPWPCDRSQTATIACDQVSLSPGIIWEIYADLGGRQQVTHIFDPLVPGSECGQSEIREHL